MRSGDLRIEACAAAAAMVLWCTLFAPAAASPASPSVASEKHWNPLAPSAVTAVFPESEPNDSLRTADSLSCGDVLLPAAISPRKDRDFVVFTVEAGETVVVGTQPSDVSGQLEDTVVTLFDAAGDSLASDDDSGPGRYSLLVYTVPTGGPYYARIAAFDTMSTGGYSAFVRCAPVPALRCELAAYDSVAQVFSPPEPIPDGLPAGKLLGPLSVPNDGQYLRDVVLGLRIDHPYLGDLSATLTYDVECDGTPEASARVLCRPGRSGCEIGDDTGCPVGLSCDRIYYLSDAAQAEIGLVPFGCGSTGELLPGGCYRPSSTGEPLSTFARLPRGGCFRLVIADWLLSDEGSLCEWRVFMASSTTSVRASSWSQIKQLYR